MKPGATLIQMLLVLGLAGVLGVIFNNANPLGLRVAAPVPRWTNAAPLAISSPTNAPLLVRVTALPVPSAPVLPTNVPVPLPVAGTITPPPTPPPAAPAPIIGVTWPQTKEQLADGRTVLVDARMANYFEAGHIPHAVSLPATSSGEIVATFVAKYPPATTPLIVYCGAESCHLSHALAAMLTTQHGYTNVKVMGGGYTEFLRAEAAANSAAPK